MLDFMKSIGIISEDTIRSFISRISLIKQGQFEEFVSQTRDVFDARLMSYTSRNQHWHLGAVLGEIGLMMNLLYERLLHSQFLGEHLKCSL